MPPTATPAPTTTPTSVPTATPRPVVSPTQVGSFVLTRALGTYVDGVLPAVQLPDWIELSGDRETWFLARVPEAYQPLTTPCDLETCKEVFEAHYGDVITTADDFLGQYPDTDGAIPVLMMMGHVHSYQVGWYWGRSSELLGWEYEQAIALLLERHPERLPYILNDLIDLGLPINWVQSTDLDRDSGEALLFTYQFSPRYGEPKGQIYALMGEPNHSWAFAPLPTRYADGWQHGAHVETIADINADGQTEVVVNLTHAYAGGPGLWLHVFAWQDGAWSDRLSWNPLAGTGDAYYGVFWREDMDEDECQEIVVHYYTGPPGGGSPTTVDVYQWDQTTGTYTDTLPIEVQVCGYHAFAEAERRRALGDLEGAIPWYEEARRQWLAELNAPDSVCSSHQVASGKHEIAQSYRVQVSVQRQISNTGEVGWGVYVRNLNDEYQVEVGESALITETDTLTGAHGWQTRVNLFQCDVEPCRIVGRFYSFTSYTQDWASGDHVLCQSGTLHDYDDRDGDERVDLSQVTHWKCWVEDAQGTMLLEQDGPYIETVCLWDGYRFVLSSSEVVTPSVVLTGTLETYPQLVGIEQILARLVDCSEDR